ncbi:hypothetical protein L226DRAFT_38142 [Lentinus tigrinus ALCF2SS1-7]|uniref:uncharacterized protein n=1 Tax=Lentinus tigrinus ALCF2SS1-7 TaxID=1328758 RepID=UPI00116629A0|nr:hypothetical protein L226DRAFT_38142 [Lentinus tigrinus ALCF2SS1-7]
MKELGLNTSQVCHFIGKWGPCTRTIIDILRDYPGGHAEVEAESATLAKDTARVICANPAVFLLPLGQQTLYNLGSTVLFISPYRPRDPHTHQVWGSGRAFTHIPPPPTSPSSSTTAVSRSETTGRWSSSSGSHHML